MTACTMPIFPVAWGWDMSELKANGCGRMVLQQISSCGQTHSQTTRQKVTSMKIAESCMMGTSIASSLAATPVR